jgi:hypothetical protein
MSSIGKTFFQNRYADLAEENGLGLVFLLDHANLTRSDKNSRCSREKLGVMQNVSLAEREC